MYESHVHSYETYIRYSIVICPPSKITFVDSLVSVGLRGNVSEVASVKCGSKLSTATNNINIRTEHSRCIPKIVSYADTVRTG